MKTQNQIHTCFVRAHDGNVSIVTAKPSEADIDVLTSLSKVVLKRSLETGNVGPEHLKYWLDNVCFATPEANLGTLKARNLPG